ncbi:MAG: hypothetical protein KDD82_10245 [Planctomycetes bacterium]|nr:hypothetical protein [Planctomycetota bacterium]
MHSAARRTLALTGLALACAIPGRAQGLNPVGLAERAWAQALKDCRDSVGSFSEASFWSGELFRAQSEAKELAGGQRAFAEVGWRQRLKQLQRVAKTEADRFELASLRAVAADPHSEASSQAAVAALTSLVGALTRELEAGAGDPERLFTWATSLRLYEDELERGVFGADAGELELEVEDPGESPAARRLRERMQWLHDRLQERASSGEGASELRAAATYYRLRCQPKPALALEEDELGDTVVRADPAAIAGVNAVKACYASALEAYAAGRGSAREVYLWSLRHTWEAGSVEVLRREAAQHLERMTKLVEVARARHKTSTPADVAYLHQRAQERARQAAEAR